MACQRTGTTCITALNCVYISFLWIVRLLSLALSSTSLWDRWFCLLKSRPLFLASIPDINQKSELSESCKAASNWSKIAMGEKRMKTWRPTNFTWKEEEEKRFSQVTRRRASNYLFSLFDLSTLSDDSVQYSYTCGSRGSIYHKFTVSMDDLKAFRIASEACHHMSFFFGYSF